MHSRQAAFQSPDVQHPTRDIHLIELQLARLGDTEAMPEHEKQEAAVAGLVTASFCRADQLLHLAASEVFPVSVFVALIVLSRVYSFRSPRNPRQTGRRVSDSQ